MGNYSYLIEDDLELKDGKKEFLRKILPFMLMPETEVGMRRRYYPEDELINYNNRLNEYYKFFSEEEIKQIKSQAVTYYFDDIPTIYKHDWNVIEFLPENKIRINMDGWKIQGYWYQSYCVFLFHLWYAGVRGYIKMNEEQNQDFQINFNDNGISVDLYELLGWPEEDDPEYDAMIEREPELELTFDLKEQLRQTYNEKEVKLFYLENEERN